jgi:hypothetical protein
VSRAARVAIALGAGVLALAVAAQLLLPTIAEHRLRNDLKHSGEVEHVSISAFPAIKLLWHRADDVEVRMGRVRTGATGPFADLLARTRDADKVDAVAAEEQLVTLRLLRPSLHKRGDDLRLSATVTYADLRAALPPGFDVRPVASGNGSLVFEGSASVLGRQFRGRVVVSARDGKLVLAPDIPFGGLLTLTIFDDPRVEVLGVGARQSAAGFTLTARARLHG